MRVSKWMVPALLLSVAAYALAEDLTLTTYYPSPRGVYQELRSRGNVAIGTTSAPAARLHILGDAFTTPMRVDDAGSGDATPFLITSDGNVGIGTSSPSGSAKLDVQGKVKIVDGTQGDNKILTSDVNGLASWEDSPATPTGAVMFFNLAACPSGWTELTSARGRYLVGKPAGGTLAAAVGTALSNQENRPTGAHTHTMPWGQVSPSSGAIRAVSDNMSGGMTYDTGSAGVVPGTNAPYLQLLICQKN